MAARSACKAYPKRDSGGHRGRGGSATWRLRLERIGQVAERQVVGASDGEGSTRSILFEVPRSGGFLRWKIWTLKPSSLKLRETG